MLPRLTPVTTALLIIISAVWFYEAATGAYLNEQQLAALGAIVPGLLQRHEYWRLVAAMFLHGFWWHWGLNCWALYQLGTLYETLFGSVRFTVIYFVTGIIASAASSLHMQQGLGVGASGAIFGILGAFIFSIRRSPQYRHQPWTRSLINQLAFWIVANVIIGFSFPGIDNTAHIAGLVSGLLLGFWPHRVPPPPPRDMIIDIPPPPQSYGSE
ncbi:MAG TPA: rhomboid family intramembrane serine protease [Thermoanaerobaculia bacterium]|nr:rhomboid family intramembrane serine protease [Thermoanaerobaculia bacterium]